MTSRTLDFTNKPWQMLVKANIEIYLKNNNNKIFRINFRNKTFKMCLTYHWQSKGRPHKFVINR